MQRGVPIPAARRFFIARYDGHLCRTTHSCAVSNCLPGVAIRSPECCNSESRVLQFGVPSVAIRSPECLQFGVPSVAIRSPECCNSESRVCSLITPNCAERDRRAVHVQLAPLEAAGEPGLTRIDNGTLHVLFFWWWWWWCEGISSRAPPYDHSQTLMQQRVPRRFLRCQNTKQNPRRSPLLVQGSPKSAYLRSSHLLLKPQQPRFFVLCLPWAFRGAEHTKASTPHVSGVAVSIDGDEFSWE